MTAQSDNNTPEPWVTQVPALAVNRWHAAVDGGMCRIAVAEQVGSVITPRGVIGMSYENARQLAESIMMMIPQGAPQVTSQPAGQA